MEIGLTGHGLYPLPFTTDLHHCEGWLRDMSNSKNALEGTETKHDEAMARPVFGL